MSDVGKDPDPRFTLANERTLLAWNRTALALIAGGLGVAQLLEIGPDALRLVMALSLLALGGTAAFAGNRRWEASERALRLNEPIPKSRLPRLLAIGVACVAVSAIAVVIVDVVAT